MPNKSVPRQCLQVAKSRTSEWSFDKSLIISTNDIVFSSPSSYNSKMAMLVHDPDRTAGHRFTNPMWYASDSESPPRHAMFISF